MKKRPASRKPGARKAAAPKRPARTTARRKTAAGGRASGAARRQPSTPKPSALRSAATAARGTAAAVVAAVTRRLPGRASEPPDAIELLETDHRRMEALLAQGEETTESAVKRRAALLDMLTAELNVHELIEERVLYPALQAHPEAKEIVLEGFQEHHVADLIVAELRQVAMDDERWGAKFKVLKENIEHHIQEEEGEMFRTARGIFSRDELRELGRRMAAMKDEAAS